MRLSFGLVTLLISAVFVGDLVGLLPRPEEQARESRKILGEALAVQLARASQTGGPSLIEATLEEIVTRNDSIVHAGLIRVDGSTVASFGPDVSESDAGKNASSFDHLVIPILANQARWGKRGFSSLRPTIGDCV